MYFSVIDGELGTVHQFTGFIQYGYTVYSEDAILKNSSSMTKDCKNVKISSRTIE